MATSKKSQRLIEKARTSVRLPKPSRLEPEPATKPKSYRVVAVSLYTPEADWVDQAVAQLKRAGHSKANRSLVIRGAILRMQEDLVGKDPDDYLPYFAEREQKRITRFRR